MLSSIRSQQIHHWVQRAVLWRWLICLYVDVVFAKWMRLFEIRSRLWVSGDLVSTPPVQELLSHSLRPCTIPPHKPFVVLVALLITCFLPHCNICARFQHIIILVSKGVLSFETFVDKIVGYLVFHYLDALVTCVVVHWELSR